MRKGSKIDWFVVTVFTLALVAVISMWKSSGEQIPELLRETFVAPLLQPWGMGNAVVFSLSVSYLASFMLWIMVVWLPDRRRRGILKSNLQKHYQSFREDVVRILLCAADRSEGIDLELSRKLTDHEEFREYFSQNKNEHWYAALNGLQAHHEFLEDLILEIDIFAGEIKFILAKLEFDDPETIAFFKRLSHHVERLKRASVYSYDQVKYLGNFIWELLARWSMIYGQRKDDIVETMIRRI